MACSGPASSPISARALATGSSSTPADGVITNQTSGLVIGVEPVWASSCTSARPENRPTTPCEAMTSAAAGMRAWTAASVAAAGRETRSHCSGVRGPQTAAQPSAWTTSRPASTSAVRRCRAASQASTATEPTGSSTYTGRVWNSGSAKRAPELSVLASSTTSMSGRSRR